MSEKKSVGIIGGMGPMATADLFRKITALTKAGKDSEHIRVYIDSNPEIPDRTAAILQGGPDPVPAMVDALVNLEACGADCIVMPCNTAHYFLPRLREETGITVILVSHSMEDVAKYVDRIIVMNRGQAIFDDVPREVFRHYKELEAIGLAAPQVTYIVRELRERGLPVDTDITTIEEAKRAILKAVGDREAGK